MFISLRKRIRQGILLGCVSGAALLVLVVGQASAATYPGGGSTFTGSAEGWKVAASPEKSCNLLTLLKIELLCSNNGAYDGTNGVPAGSFAVSTNIPINLISIFKSDVTAESPVFTAVGTGSGSLSLARSFAPGGLLTLTPQFTYTANLLDKTTNTKQKAITETIEGEVPYAVKTGAVSLTAGHSYVIQIETTDASSVASIGLLGGEAIARFDNVTVTGADAPTTPGGNDGANGGNGGNGSSGGAGEEGGSGGKGSAGGVSSATLESLIKSSSLIGPATLKGNRISVKAKCPTKVNATCTISLQGMLSRKKAATAGRKAKVKVGKTKNFALSVKPAARKVVKTKTKLLFKETVKAGQAKATVYKSLKLVRK